VKRTAVLSNWKEGETKKKMLKNDKGSKPNRFLE